MCLGVSAAIMWQLNFMVHLESVYYLTFEVDVFVRHGSCAVFVLSIELFNKELNYPSGPLTFNVLVIKNE